MAKPNRTRRSSAKPAAKAGTAKPTAAVKTRTDRALQSIVQTPAERKQQQLQDVFDRARARGQKRGAQAAAQQMGYEQGLREGLKMKRTSNRK